MQELAKVSKELRCCSVDRLTNILNFAEISDFLGERPLKYLTGLPNAKIFIVRAHAHWHEYM